jgi:hypothetical protein
MSELGTKRDDNTPLDTPARRRRDPKPAVTADMVEEFNRHQKETGDVCVGGLVEFFGGKRLNATPLQEGCATSKKPDVTSIQEAGTNPKKQFGDKSVPLNLWPALASAYGSLGLYNGKLKYGMSNFNATPVEASIYIAGAMRHLNAWAEGEEFDPADGVPNLGGVLANIAILLEARAAGTLVDDRKLGTGYLKERETLKAIVESLQVLHTGKNPRHYTIKDTK